MGGNVFANGLEISGKAVQAQTIAVFPDVCFTPPENPATPPGVPIPYPSFGMASDTESGTATVLISGEIVNIKNKSDEKKTSGTEAGCAAKKGVITSKNTGKKYFNSWSSDVKFEGEPVIRFTDIATHNHASPAANTPPGPEISTASPPDSGGNATDADCLVGPYSEVKEECNKRRDANGNAHEAHHIVPDRVYRTGVRGSTDRMDTAKFPTEAAGMNICLPRAQHRGSVKNHPESVHGNLDNALEALGKISNTPTCPADVEKIKIIRKECIAALVKLVPKYISKECLKKAAREVVKQTETIGDQMGRTKKDPLAPSSAACKLLKSQ